MKAALQTFNFLFMRFILFLSLLATACTSKGPSVNTSPQPIQPEALGTPNSEQQGSSFTISTEAFYQASVNSSTSPGRVISLSLSPKRKAEMTTDYLDKSQIMVDTGGWTTLENGNLQLNLRRKGESGNIQLEFKTDGEKLVYTGSEYGTEGLTLWVKPVPK